MRRCSGLIVATLLFAAFVAAAPGAEYRFLVPRCVMRVVVRPDASVRVAYDITFKNAPGAYPIDIVDIGALGPGYDLRSATASIGGMRLTDIRKSTEISTGFEVHLHGATIGPGGSGTLHAEYTMPNAVFQDTTREDYASLQVVPTWFGSQYVLGTTDLYVVVQLPKGVKPDQVVWQDVKFDEAGAGDDTVVVGWRRQHFRLDHRERFAVSFAKGNMRVVRMTKFGLLRKWFAESRKARIWVGIAVVAAWTFVFFRFTGATGVSVYVVLTGLLVWLFVVSPEAQLISVPVVAALVFLNERGLQRRKARYMSPIAQVEGGGIKRGLTAPEAALLLELPLSKVLTLVIFGMLKKGILRQMAADPLRVAVNEPFAVDSDTLHTTPDQRAKRYREIAHTTGVAVHGYEHPFLYLIQQNPAKALADINFSAPMKQLIAHVVERMKNFDVSDTQDYYRSIICQAMTQAKSIGDVPMREKVVDRHFEWILMDDGFPTVFRDWDYWPVWTRGHERVFTGQLGPGGGMAVPTGGGTGGTTSFGDVAASFAGWTENTMGRMASAIGPDSLAIPKPSGGFLNLSGADSVTGQVLSSLFEGRGGGGGGGFGGCACAGCACACACAGGGR